MIPKKKKKEHVHIFQKIIILQFPVMRIDLNFAHFEG